MHAYHEPPNQGRTSLAYALVCLIGAVRRPPHRQKAYHVAQLVAQRGGGAKRTKAPRSVTPCRAWAAVSIPWLTGSTDGDIAGSRGTHAFPAERLSTERESASASMPTGLIARHVAQWPGLARLVRFRPDCRQVGTAETVSQIRAASPITRGGAINTSTLTSSGDVMPFGPAPQHLASNGPIRTA